ncbi:hypothetical protein [Virgibacillus pantothenticus]|uniref:hypothetical protein n=1 Tax=Virgibacillus pantothenticus TaxID=1473 RepID=UPI000986447C|nr:hypothetical protein [Virgibacillus pantothenticus]
MAITDRDLELLDDLFNGRADIQHQTSERFAEDLKDIIRDMVTAYKEAKEDANYLQEDSEMAEKHIKKLESMLDRRKVRYKKWEDRYL